MKMIPSDTFQSDRRSAFTLVELLTVIVIIIALAALTVQVAGVVNQKAARDRARTEIASLEVALESYKADNGAYPDTSSAQIAFNATVTEGTIYSMDPNGYKNASKILYQELSADFNADGDTSDTDVNGRDETKSKTYFPFKDNMLSKSSDAVAAIIDPFGYSYGYSTLQSSGTDPTKGFNPTFDLWSTGGKTGSTDKDKANWVTNWN